jgi:hypothetical protein
MSSGVRNKFNGSQIQILTGFASPSPADTITGITQADPPVVSETAHGRASGDVIMLSDVVGMTEVNDIPFIIDVLTNGTYELVGVKAAGYGAYVSGGEVASGELSNFCELTGYNRSGGTSAEIDATTICSDAQEFEVGLPDFGTTQIDFNFAPQTAIQQAISDYYSGANAGEKMAVKVILPGNGGTMVQIGTIQQTSEQGVVNGLWTGSLTIRNTGKREDFAAS